MTHLLRLTDGTNTVTFTTAPIKVMEYQPMVSMDGAPIQETARVDFYSSTQSTNIASIQAANRLLAQARNYGDTQTGPRVYIEFDPGATGTVYRSLILDGSGPPDSEILKIKYFNNKNLVIDFKWTRVPFWEASTAVQVPLSNTSASSNTSGLTITNSNDATAENFTDILAVDVIGDLPAPVKLELENTKSGADASKEIYIWHNVYSSPSSFLHVLEGEDATGGTVTDSGTDTTSSSDKYTTLAWTATVETLIAEWALSDTLMTYAAGGRFAFLARWRGVFPYTNAWIRMKTLDPNGNIQWTGKLTLIDSIAELTMLDVTRLPQYQAGEASQQATILRMYGYRPVSGTHSIPIDYLQLSPISGDGGWKRFLFFSDGVAYQEKFVHDGNIDGYDKHFNTSSKSITDFSAFGGPVMLVPGVNQRLYFNSRDKDGEAKVDQTWKVKLWYRPRRNSL